MAFAVMASAVTAPLVLLTEPPQFWFPPVGPVVMTIPYFVMGVPANSIQPVMTFFPVEQFAVDESVDVAAFNVVAVPVLTS